MRPHGAEPARVALVLALNVLGAAAAAGHQAANTNARMAITRSGSEPSQSGPSANFTGEVRVQPLFAPREGSSVAGASVTFAPGARSAWHTHPRGQVLIVTAGVGRVQQWGEPPQEIRPGDVVWTPPAVRHWHGAAPGSAMTHLAIQESANGSAVTWLEKVTDEQYGQGPAGAAAAGAAVATTASAAAPANPYADVAPALGEYTQRVLFGDLWERPGLSPRDRSLVTVATLVANYRVNELPFHLRRAQENGVTREELSELITHLAFYAGWPTANTAAEIARDVFAEDP